MDLAQLKELAQLVDNIDLDITSLEKSYNDNDGESFNKNKQDILNLAKKINEKIK